MKIYTKKGDKGKTSLFGGKRVGKDALRIEAYGTVDELNSFLGLLIASNTTYNRRIILQEIQRRLFSLGSSLAADPKQTIIKPDIMDEDVDRLEQEIDDMNNYLNPLRSFILPGGSTEIAYAHICRTICRRAERRVVHLMNREPVDDLVIRYLNRLSDFFFVLARMIAYNQNVDEIKWQARK